MSEQSLSELGRKILLDRYALKGSSPPEMGETVVYRKEHGVEIGVVTKINGHIMTIDLGDESVEVNSRDLETCKETTPEEVIGRIALAISGTEIENKNKWRKRFRWLLDDWKFVPAGRILSAAGAPGMKTPYNCFVLPSPSDSRISIIDTLKQLVEIMAHGGGVGLNVSTLRPHNAPVYSFNGRASGPTSWSELYSQAVHLVEQGGSRRGALILILETWHPDILRFIRGKHEDKLSGANISVGISDDFMTAVQEDDDWDLIFPETSHPDYDESWDGDIIAWTEKRPVVHYETVRAKDIWDAIVQSAWQSAEPGLIFLDKYNEMSNSWYFSKIKASNPCGEQGLPDWAVCNLGALNLPEFLDGKGGIEWKKLKKATEYAVRFLDNVIDGANHVYDPVLKVQQAQRRIGLGTMGLGELLIRLKIRYGSPECLEFLDRLYEFIATTAYLASAHIAEEKGSFPEFEAEKFLLSGFMKAMPDKTRKVVREKGIRNTTLLTQAPTGSIATMVGTSTGIEPFFSWVYSNKNRLGTHTVTATVVTEWQAANPDATLPDYFVTAQELSVELHVRVQSSIQRWIDAGVSKTCNMPTGASVDQVSEAYRLMHVLGCKGGTIYIDGSIKNQPLSHPDDKIKVRPVKLYGCTYRKNTPVGTCYITINEDINTGPFEVFINIGKVGSAIAADAEALGRLISLILRLSSSSSSYERVQGVIGQLRGIGSGRSSGFGANRVMSLPDAVAQILAEHVGIETDDKLPGLPDISDSISKIGDICPSCGQAAFIFEESCQKCHLCGYSEC